MATDDRTVDRAPLFADLATARSALRLWLLAVSEDSFDADVSQVSLRAIAEALSEAASSNGPMNLVFAEKLVWMAESALWQHTAEGKPQPDVDDLKRVGRHALALVDDVLAGLEHGATVPASAAKVVSLAAFGLGQRGALDN